MKIVIHYLPLEEYNHYYKNEFHAILKNGLGIDTLFRYLLKHLFGKNASGRIFLKIAF